MKLFSRTKHSGRSGQGMQQIPQTILELRQTFTGKWTTMMERSIDGLILLTSFDAALILS